MFILNSIKKEDATGELKLVYKMIEKSLGFIPPHFELFATIDTKSMMEFLELHKYFTTHEHIDSNLLAYLRLYIANKEHRAYCINFNSVMLTNMGINKNIITNILDEVHNIPLEQAQVKLLKKVIKSIYNSKQFEKNDLDELYERGFNDKDFFDLLSYAVNFMGKSKMIEVYLKK